MWSIYLLLLHIVFAQHSSSTTTKIPTALANSKSEAIVKESSSTVIEVRSKLDYVALANNLLHHFFEHQEACLFNNKTKLAVKVIACCVAYCDDDSIATPPTLTGYSPLNVTGIMSYYISPNSCGDSVPTNFITVAKNNDPMPSNEGGDCSGIGLNWKSVPENAPSFPTSSRDTQVRPPSKIPFDNKTLPNLNATETTQKPATSLDQKSSHASELGHENGHYSEPNISDSYTYRKKLEPELNPDAQFDVGKSYRGRAEFINIQYRNSDAKSSSILHYVFMLNMLLLR